jgi:hemerythrin-like domain-containing protein
MPNVFDVLGHDHDEVKQMLAELEAGPTAATGADSSDLARRKKLVEQLVIEESKHEAVEEMYFWPAVRDKIPDGGRLADTAIGQEQEGKKVLDKLDKAEASEPEFEQLVTTIIQAGREHISYEETKVWPQLRTALSAQEASELGDKIEQGKKTAPTRPHPHTPASPAALKTAGPAVAAADRARDAASGRGE